MHHSEMKSEVRRLIADGTVIPAHPLALDASRALDTHPPARADALLHRRRRRRPRGRRPHHAVRDPRCRTVPARCWNWPRRRRPPGPAAAGAGRRVCAGPTQQAVAEARDRARHRLSRRAAQPRRDEIRLRRRDHRPLRGGGARNSAGRLLSAAGGRRRRSSARISGGALRQSTMSSPSRSHRSTATARSTSCAAWPPRGALDRVALYTGNDDHILLDLTLPFDLRDKGVTTRAYFRGGLLGHWSVWTASAIKQFEMCQRRARQGHAVPADLLALDARVTDCNSAFFDVANNFHGCIAGCHEILRRQGLLEGLWCLDPARRPQPRPDAGDRPRLHASTPISPTTLSSPTNLQKWLA